MSAIIDRPLRLVLTAIHSVLKAGRFVSRPKTFGAHAIALTPQGKLILVRLRYAPGWRVPGGGRPEHEDAIDAALRELREEIGMFSHGDARLARDSGHPVEVRGDVVSLVVVRDVRYRPHRWSWEVEQVREADPHALPNGMSPTSVRWIESVGPLI